MKCPLLENLHVSTFLNPVVLRNCKRLKSVVINYTGGEESTYFRNQSASTLSVLINLQVLDIFRNKNCSAYFQHIVTMLKNHPRLMSLGQSDSSWAAHHIGNNSKRDAHPQYGLRKCFWGFSIAVEDNPEQIAAYNLMFPEVIRSSILIFPLVVELHIVVRHENCLEHLKNLKHLGSLSINFEFCSDNYSSALSKLLSLLSAIGPKLKILELLQFHNVPVNIIFRHCPDLEFFQLYGAAIICGSVKTVYEFKNLKTLFVERMDAMSLQYLLRNSRDLRILYLEEASCLNDLLMEDIINGNPLAFYYLDKICVEECSLSRRGLKIFLENAENLTMAGFECYDADLSILVEELNRNIYHEYSVVRDYFDFV
ncbi:uncharacterized protein CDAR_46081 [Caerostris darwini]|uniref:Uncharacterized protein n=1 Tax=Caerostris darwini TaxID=1538125 RepID=A0AAV4XA67_9ARAC|nr:uncharacterized protein CDAR_46081 [Caerostris darwini]